MNKSLEWDLYEPYEEDVKYTALKCYFCIFFYSKTPDKIKEGVIGMILYNARNNSSFRNHVFTTHKSIFYTLFLTRVGN